MALRPVIPDKCPKCFLKPFDDSGTIESYVVPLMLGYQRRKVMRHFQKLLDDISVTREKHRVNGNTEG